MLSCAFSFVLLLVASLPCGVDVVVRTSISFEIYCPLLERMLLVAFLTNSLLWQPLITLTNDITSE